MAVVGIGTQDSLGEAEDFLSDTGVRSFPLLWDESYESWRPFGFRYQPSAVLLSADGRELARWNGSVDPDAVLAEL